MRKIYLKFLLMIFFCLNACSGYVLSPAVIYENSSPKGEVIGKIDVIWNGYHLLRTTGPEGVCGGAGNQSFALKKRSDFFGPVHIEWENAKGKKLTKDIVFTRKDFPTLKSFPSLFGPHVYRYVVLYFTQEDVEIYTSDNPDIKKIRKEKGGDWIITYVEGKGKVCIQDAKLKWGNPKINSYRVDRKGKRIEE